MRALRPALAAVVLVAMAASAAYSANSFGLRDRYRPPAARLGEPLAAAPAASASPAASAQPAATAPYDGRSQPWWQPVAVLEGDGAGETRPFEIARRALQWRVSWRCETGRFEAVPVAAGGGRARRAVVPAADCPGEGKGFSVRTGSFSLAVHATGRWQVQVEQQVDIPMVEPVPHGGDAPGAATLATGAVYDVDRVGKGSVRILQLPDGTRVLRLEGFFVSINSDLELRLSPLPAPRSTPEVASAPMTHLAMLKATVGSMNYVVPPDVDLSKVGSVVVWCEITSNAYAAASLR